MTNRLTRSKIESYSYANVLAFVDNRTYIKDPRNPTSLNKLRTFVYDSDPLMKGINFGDFPYIILELPTVEYEQDKNSINGKVKIVGFKHEITVRSAKDGSANTTGGIGRSDILDIGDDLNETFNSETVKQLFRDLDMYNLNLIKLATSDGIVKQKAIYESQYELTYETRMQVSE